MLNGKAKAILATIRINRKLKGIKSRPFRKKQEWWRGSERTTIHIYGKLVNFTDVFTNFEDIPAVRRVFGKDTDKVFSKLKVGIYDNMGYAWVDEGRNRLMISKRYLEKGRLVYLYLDVVHELVHFKQHMNGKNLWDMRYDYVDRPTEIEAYRACCAEAKRLGMNRREIASYLYMNWLSKEQFNRLLKAAGC